MSAVLFLFVFAIGACVGSFLNVCISRWPEELSVVRPPSRCPRCGNGIAWYDNIPIVSWLVLRAKCRHCALPISAVYPAVELAIAVIWVGNRRRLRYQRRALLCTHPHQAQLAAADMRLYHRQVVEQHLQLPRQRVGQSEAAAFVRHMHQVNFRQRFQILR